MHFYRLPRWISQSICQLFPRRYCCRQLPFVHNCNCRAPKPIQLRVDMLESRESPTSLAGPNPLASSLSAAAFTSVVTAEQDAFAEPSWHSPAFEFSTQVGRNSNPSHETSASEVSTSAPAQGANAPRSAETQNSSANWAAFSSADLIPDPFASDFSLLAKPQAGGASSAELANLRSSPGDGGSTSGAGAGSSPGLSQGGGPGSLSSSGLDSNPLSGLAPSSGAGGVNPLSSPNATGLPANGIVPTPRVANPAGSPTTPLTSDHGLLTTDNPPLTQPTTSKPPAPSSDYG